ncbi:MAG TPA: FecR domain-containing protein [Candidatus Sulfopaludibacter sp.]|jgi:ferric-dicitrate binding protein FerR (iron transport regulator)|nr:FecR domain-containing protein [Candidatus Sulfopaludibacter sp.]
MNEDYLWDRSGPPDPAVEHLERTLAPLRYRHRAEFTPRTLWPRLAAAAALVAAAGLLLNTVPKARVTAWQVARFQGSASMAGKQVTVATPLGAGQLLKTGAQSEITLHADEVGKIDLGPNSELRATSGRRIQLQRGQLHAFIWAPPREFVVDTPSSRAVDLGCEYTLNVDSAGNGLVHVEMGWVAFQYEDREAFIPAGAECATHKSRGPGVPFYADAPPQWRASLAAWEAGDSSRLDAVVGAARPRDAITLWHLLTRLPPPARGVVFDKFAEMVPLPQEVTRDAVLQGDRHALDLCWNALGLENTSWWRGWERPWR